MEELHYDYTMYNNLKRENLIIDSELEKIDCEYDEIIHSLDDDTLRITLHQFSNKDHYEKCVRFFKKILPRGFLIIAVLTLLYIPFLSSLFLIIPNFLISSIVYLAILHKKISESRNGIKEYLRNEELLKQNNNDAITRLRSLKENIAFLIEQKDKNSKQMEKLGQKIIDYIANEIELEYQRLGICENIDIDSIKITQDSKNRVELLLKKRDSHE